MSTRAVSTAVAVAKPKGKAVRTEARRPETQRQPLIERRLDALFKDMPVNDVMRIVMFGRLLDSDTEWDLDIEGYMDDLRTKWNEKLEAAYEAGELDTEASWAWEMLAMLRRKDGPDRAMSIVKGAL